MAIRLENLKYIYKDLIYVFLLAFALSLFLAFVYNIAVILEIVFSALLAAITVYFIGDRLAAILGTKRLYVDILIFVGYIIIGLWHAWVDAILTAIALFSMVLSKR